MELRVDGAVAHEEPDRRVVSQRLLDGGWDEITVGAQSLEEIGIIRQGPQDVGDEVAGGLIPRDKEEHELSARLDVGQATTLNLGADQPGDEVVTRHSASRSDEGIDICHELGVSTREP